MSKTVNLLLSLEEGRSLLATPTSPNILPLPASPSPPQPTLPSVATAQEKGQPEPYLESHPSQNSPTNTPTQYPPSPALNWSTSPSPIPTPHL
jgi:hypothetical protein